METLQTLPPVFKTEKELPTTPAEIKLREIGETMAASLSSAMKDYRDMLRHIRQTGIARDAIRRALVRDCGMSESWVSQVYKVALAPETLFIEYDKGDVSFRAVLEKAREVTQNPKGKKSQLRRLRGTLLGLAHKVGKLAIEEDNDFVAVLPDVSTQLTDTRECKVTIGEYQIHVTKKAK